MPEKWEELVADKRARLEKTIPAEWKIQTLPTEDSVIDYPTKSGLLSAKELEITNSTATDLVAKLATGELKSYDVTLAFCKRAALAHQLVSRFIDQRDIYIYMHGLRWINFSAWEVA